MRSRYIFNYLRTNNIGILCQVMPMGEYLFRPILKPTPKKIRIRQYE